MLFYAAVGTAFLASLFFTIPATYYATINIHAVAPVTTDTLFYPPFPANNGPGQPDGDAQESGF